MNELSLLHTQRLERWGQTQATRIADSAAAPALIERVGVATLFPVSPELPNLFQSYLGDPAASTDSKWDSPSGEVYSWRWALGRSEVAFYTAIVRGRPTWVSWKMLPAVIRLRGTLQAPDELYAAGEISEGAHRIAGALAENGGVLSTGELRQLAGFPTGKDQRAAYLKAIAELDGRLLLAKRFAPNDDDMRHGLVEICYPQHVAAAEALSPEAALEQFLICYLPQAIYAVPTVLARHLGLPEVALRGGLEGLVGRGLAEAATLAGKKGSCYIWSMQGQ